MLNNKQKKKGRWYHVAGILLLCFAIIYLTYTSTYSWFRDKSTTSNKPDIAIIGTIALDVTTNFNFENLALAPDTTYTGTGFETKVKTAPDHDINGAFVRIKFTTNRSEISLHFNNQLTTSTDVATAENKWFYNETDNYYYYIGRIYDTDVQFNDGYSVDNTLHNKKAGAKVEMSFIVEGLQWQYDAYLAEWQTAPAVFKSYAQSVQI
ncbi:MAG: hypothetical protein E7345_03305 [Clostridiales bacterium]|nr:hypothetical protein [Clostridiales bacterium]